MTIRKRNFLWAAITLLVLGMAAMVGAAVTQADIARIKAKVEAGEELSPADIALAEEINATTGSHIDIGAALERAKLKRDGIEEHPRPPRNPLDLYVWTETTYNWVDITGVGQNANITGDDQNVGPFPIGFDFTFYGNTYNSIRICSNGFLSFTSTSTTYSNTAIPTATEPNNALYVFWDDLYPPSGGHQILYYYDSANNRFIVSYINIAHIQSSSARYTFQVILYPNGHIVYQYNSISSVAPGNTSCTVGIENASGTEAVQVCFNGAGSLPTNGWAILFAEPAGVPRPPTNLLAAQQGSNVVLTWTDPNQDINGNPITIDSLQVWLGSVGGTYLGRVNPGVQTFTHPNPPNGRNRYYVRAFNAGFPGQPAMAEIIIGGPEWLEWTYEWFDISQIGTNTGMTGDDQNVGPFQLGFTFPFYGNTYTTMRICSNGWISPTSTSTAYWEQPIPSTSEPNNAIYVFWDDMYLPSGGGAVYYYADAQNQRFIVQWHNIAHISNQNQRYTYQVILTSSGSIFCYYHTIPALNSLVGVENATGTEAIQLWYQTSGEFTPNSGTAVAFWPGVLDTAFVSGTVSLDGGAGVITEVVVQANGFQNPWTRPAANGAYTIRGVQVGNRIIRGTLAGYNPASVAVNVPAGGITGVNLTLRRVNPPIPTGLSHTQDTSGQIVTLNWDDSPDPLVDYYRVWRKLRDDTAWVHVRTFVPSAGVDTLPSPGIYNYCVSAVDTNVTPPFAESGRSSSIQVLYGELPPTLLTASGNFDDRIRLRWLAPGVQQPPRMLCYDDGTSETWYRVTTPNRDQDYFAVRFTPPPPDSTAYPLLVQTCNILMERSDPLPNVWICPNTAQNTPDLANPYRNWQNIGADGSPGWLIADANGEISLPNPSDFWVVWQFPPGQTGPGSGADNSAPDNRSYWYYDLDPIWHLWTSNDWICRVWVGARQQGTLFVLSPGSGYPASDLPAMQTHRPDLFEKYGRVVEYAPPAPGPVRPVVQANSFASRLPEPFRIFEEPYYRAPELVWQPSDRGRNPLDDPDYYIVYRDNVDIAHPTQTTYDDMVAEGITYSYYVTAHYPNGVESGPTNTVQAMAAMPPGAPTNVTGLPLDSRRIRITWTDPTVNADGTPCVDLDSIRIFRDGVLIGTVDAGVQQFVDQPPSPMQTYVWTVRGIDEVPNMGPAGTFTGSVVSPWMETGFDWVDISNQGTQIPLGDDQNMGPFPLGFNFTYYGQTFNSIRVCSNGWLSFTSTGVTLYPPCPPNAQDPNNALFLLALDLNPGAGGQVRYFADAANQRFIVSWLNVPRFGQANVLFTMQCIIRSDGGIVFQYQNLTRNTEGVVGVEDATASPASISLWCNGSGLFAPVNQSAVQFWGAPPEYCDVYGRITLDGGSGVVTQVLVSANGVSRPTANPAPNGDYVLRDVQIGNRILRAELAGYRTATLTIFIPDTNDVFGQNMTLRRLDPPAPTNLTASVNSSNGLVTLNWDDSPDLLVDLYRVYRKLRDEQNWTFQSAVIGRTNSQTTNQLPAAGVYQFRVTAVDTNVTPPALESPPSNVADALYGALPPERLDANGNFDDRIRLRWLPPGINQPPYQIFYDDSSSEAWYRVTTPNRTQDYFAVRFTPPPPDTIAYPLMVQSCHIYMERNDPLPNVWLCPNTAQNTPDLANSYRNWQAIGADGTPGWINAMVNGEVTLPTPADFWLVWQFPPNQTGPGTGSDQSAPDLRSYWYYDLDPIWHLWTSHDWMARVWVGGPRGQAFVLTPGGYVIPEVTPEHIAMHELETGKCGHTAELSAAGANSGAVGPVRPKKAALSFSSVLSNPVPPPTPTAIPPQQPSFGDRGRRTLDDVVSYRIYRNGTFLAQVPASQTTYDNTGLQENVWYRYHVTAVYDNGQESPPSVPDSAACNMAPGAPTNVSCTPVGQSMMRIQWTDPTVNADGTPCVDLAALRIYRNGIQIGQVNPGVGQFTHTPPDPMEIYTYTVRGLDEVPNIGPAGSCTGGVQSPWRTVDYEWVDITGQGTRIVNCDDCNQGPFNLGFTFTYYGQDFTSIRVCSNGWLSFTSSSSALSVPCPPSSNDPNNALFLLTFDLNPAAGGQVLYYADAANGRFIVSWINVPRYYNTGSHTMQCIIDDDGGITYQYQSLTSNNPAVVGVEDATGSAAGSIALWCNGTGVFTPANETAVKFWGGPESQIVGTVRAFGSNAPIASARVWTLVGSDTMETFTQTDGFYALPLEPGTYTVRYHHSHYCDSVRTVTLDAGETDTVNVHLRAPQIQISVTSIVISTPPGVNAQFPFTISNNGGQCPLTFGITDTSVWLTVNPASGTIAPNGTTTITVHANVQGMPPGTHRISALRIAANVAGSPFDRRVDLYIGESADELSSAVPTEFAYHPNYPNPFNATTTLMFDLPRESHVELVIYNVMGQEVARPVSGVWPAGRHRVLYDAADLPSGMYIVRMNAGEFHSMGKMLLLK